MKIKEIQDLISFISESGLNEVNIETADIKLSIRKDADIQQTIVESAQAAAPVAAPVAAAPAPTSSAETCTSEPAPSAGSLEIKSPMIGTFYRSPNPDSPPFLKVGDKVTKGQAVCVVEAMKLFNEIESEVSGTVVKVLVEDASPVEYDQPLFLVDPS